MKRLLPIVALVLFTWAGAGVISYVAVDLTDGGPQGEQGVQGERGPRGSSGESQTETTDLFSECDKAATAYTDGLATPGLSEQQVLALYGVAAQLCGW